MLQICLNSFQRTPYDYLCFNLVNLDIYSIKVNIDPRPFKQSSVLYNMTHDVKKEKPLTKSDIYDNLQHQF